MEIVECQSEYLMAQDRQLGWNNAFTHNLQAAKRIGMIVHPVPETKSVG